MPASKGHTLYDSITRHFQMTKPQRGRAGRLLLGVGGRGQRLGWEAARGCGAVWGPRPGALLYLDCAGRRVNVPIRGNCIHTKARQTC